MRSPISTRMVTARGYFFAGGSHSLEDFVNSVAKDIQDPETKMTIWQRLRLRQISNGTPKLRAELKSRPDLRIAALGSGSDYTVFTDHLGVASLDSDSEGKTRAASITRSTTIFTITRISTIPISRTGGPWRKPPALW